jgi:hypothetical protein
MGESARRLGIAATSALTSAPTAPPVSLAVATRTPTVISLELAGPDDNEHSVDSSLPSAPAPLLDSFASDLRYFVLDAATGSAFRLPDSDPKEPIQHQALVGVLPFPGSATRVRDDRLLAASVALAEQVTEEHFAKGLGLHDFLCDDHDLAPPRRTTATRIHLARA